MPWKRLGAHGKYVVSARMRLGGGQEISLTLPRWFHTAFKTLRDAPAKSRKTSCKNLDFAERIGSVLDRLGSVFEGMGRVLHQLGRVLEAPKKSSQRLQDSFMMLQHALRHAIKVQKNNRQKSGLCRAHLGCLGSPWKRLGVHTKCYVSASAQKIIV